MSINLKITQEQLAQYRSEGYTMLGKVLTDDQLEGLRALEARLRHERCDEGRTYFFGKTTPYSPVVRDVALNGSFVPLLPEFVGSPNIVLRHDQFVSKMPDGGKAKSDFPWHQDEGYEPVYPPLGVTVWIALDDMTLENGCVWVHPKSHLLGNMPHEARGGDGFLTLEVEGDGIPAIMKAGEAIAFTGLTLHRSKYNTTNKVRRAYFLGYADADATYHPRSAEKPMPIAGSPHSWVVLGEGSVRK